MNRDLFLAILAMDVYNRGYGAGIKGLPVAGKLGQATIFTDASSKLDANTVLAAGFYAIAYDVSGVENLSGTVIAYRGADAPIRLAA